jgi:hypothetical protein
MESLLIEEQVVAEQYREPALADIPQTATSGGGSAITEISSSTITVNDPGDGTRNIELPQALGTGAGPTFANITISALATLSQLKVNSGATATIKRIEANTVAADPGSIAAQTRGSIDVTITGVAVGDIVVMDPPDGLNAGLVYGGCRVTANNTLRIYLANITGAAIDDGSTVYDFLWFDLT